jgi:SNF2 family DNA or RNA helicase
VLIVCPKQVRLNWQREIKEFCKVETHVEVVRGSQIDRISALIDAKRASRTAHLSVAVMGYDSIPGTWEALKLMKWSLCVADESHFFKSHSTKRWSFMEKLRETCDKRIACTGTPIANSINDLWTQLEWLCKGASGFNSFAAFKQHFGVYDRRGDGSFERFLGLQNVPIIKDRLSKYSFSITKKEAMPSLPDKLYDVVEVEMTEDQMLAYEKMKTALQFEIEGVMNSDLNPSVQVNNILTMLMKLAQITSGFIKTPDVKDAMGDVIAKGTIITFSPNPKVEALSEILLAKGKYDKTLVWAHFKHDIQKIKLMCDTIGIKAVTFDGGTSDDNRAEAERAFNNDDDCKVFIGNPGAGGTGLNLLGFPPQDPSASQCNANHTIYFSQDWSSLKRSQSEDRNHRRGVRTCIQVTDLCIANTIDEQIRERVASKRLNALEITDVRDLLKNIFNTKLK